MRTLSSLLPGAAMFVAALTVNAATVCQGEILNPVTDVCWSCVFPVKIGGKASLTPTRVRADRSAPVAKAST